MVIQGTLASFDMGAANLAVCVLDIETKQIQHWFLINIFEQESAETKQVVKSSKRTVDQHIEALIPALNRHTSIFDSVTHVAIEQQPSGRGAFANNKMHNLQHALKTWFLTRYGICAQIVSPKHKLKIIRERLKEQDDLCDGDKPSTPTNPSKRYAYHKKRAIQCTTLIGPIHATETQMTLYSASGKKDDYADAFLQGLWRIHQLELEEAKALRKAELARKKALRESKKKKKTSRKRKTTD